MNARRIGVEARQVVGVLIRPALEPETLGINRRGLPSTHPQQQSKQCAHDPQPCLHILTPHLPIDFPPP